MSPCWLSSFADVRIHILTAGCNDLFFKHTWLYVIYKHCKLYISFLSMIYCMATFLKVKVNLPFCVIPFFLKWVLHTATVAVYSTGAVMKLRAQLNEEPVFLLITHWCSSPLPLPSFLFGLASCSFIFISLKWKYPIWWWWWWWWWSHPESVDAFNWFKTRGVEHSLLTQSLHFSQDGKSVYQTDERSGGLHCGL